MSRLKSISIAAISLALPLSAFNPLIAQASTAQESNPLCYFHTKDGRTINLTSMCGYQPPEICQFIGDDKSEKTVLIQNFCKKHEKCKLDNSCNSQPIPNFDPTLTGPQGVLAPSILARR